MLEPHLAVIRQRERRVGIHPGHVTVHLTHTHTRLTRTQESLIHQIPREETEGPDGNHTTQKRARIKSTCRESYYGVVYKRVPACRKPHIPGAWAQWPFTLLMPSALLCSWLQSATPLFLIPSFSPSPGYLWCPASSSSSSSSSCLPHADPFAWGHSSLSPSSLAWLLSFKDPFLLVSGIPATGSWRAVCQWPSLNSTHSSLFPFPLHSSLLWHRRWFSLPLTYIFCFSPAILGIWLYTAGVSFSYFLYTLSTDPFLCDFSLCQHNFLLHMAFYLWRSFIESAYSSQFIFSAADSG